MMSCRYWHTTTLILGLALVVLAVLPAASRAQEMNLELVVNKDAVPPDGSQWHELFPNHCAMHTQTDYEDNGDGEISPCDAINLENAAGVVSGWHITWVGPTYTLVPCQGGDPSWHEPVDPLPGENPTCENWEEVWPNNGDIEHVDGWNDNGDGILNECDEVILNGVCYHIELIGLNIIVEPGPVPTESSTWGKIKNLY